MVLMHVALRTQTIRIFSHAASVWLQRAAVAVLEDGEGAEGEEAAPESVSFDYLLSMPIHSLTREKARAIHLCCLTLMPVRDHAAVVGSPFNPIARTSAPRHAAHHGDSDTSH